MMSARERHSVAGSPIDSITWNATLRRLSAWADKRESRVVSICNVHSVITAHTDRAFSRVIEDSDLATPDGAPVAWVVGYLSGKVQSRINGPDLMWRYCELAASRNESIYLYGGRPEVLDALCSRLKTSFPGLRIVGAYSPPFRELTAVEEQEVVQNINSSGAGIVWVGLGCPKQEQWMMAKRGRINAVMVGVGAAFDYHAGTLSRAPLWMQNHGLEWLYRLAQEPRRLWRRYALTNSKFIILAGRQLIDHTLVSLRMRLSGRGRTRR